jgi:peroxiredoxin
MSLAAIAACGSQDGSESGSATNQRAGEKGSTAPDFALERVEGGTLSLSSLRGKAVIVDFWDTWCPPCRKALPDLQEISDEYGPDLVVVGVAMAQEGKDKVRAFTRKHGLTFEMVLFNQDPELIRAFGGIRSIPTTFLIDHEGVIREKWVGAAPKSAYEKAVRGVLGA